MGDVSSRFFKTSILLYPQLLPFVKVLLSPFYLYFATKTWRKTVFFKKCCPSKQSTCCPLLFIFTMLPFISGVVTCLLWKMMMPSICLIIALMFCRTRLTFLSSNLAFTFAFLLVLRLLTNHEPLKNDDVIKTETL